MPKGKSWREDPELYSELMRRHAENERRRVVEPAIRTPPDVKQRPPGGRGYFGPAGPTPRAAGGTS